MRMFARKTPLPTLLRVLSSRSASTTADQAIRDLRTKFTNENVPEPELSAAHLVGGVIGCKSVDALQENGHKWSLNEGQQLNLESWARCRLARMPVQYILKEWDFRELTLKMRPPVFIPRPETEELVSLVIPHLRSGQRVLEVGCGSGAICLSLLHALPGCLQVLALDRSKAACALTIENAVENQVTEGLTVVQATVMENGNVKSELLPQFQLQKFDLVVSNPPYVLRKDLTVLAPEITLYEDLRALDGGKHGMDVIVPILKLCEKQLEVCGRLFLEVDPCHPFLLPDVLLECAASMKLDSVHQDFAGKDRFVVLRKDS